MGSKKDYIFLLIFTVLLCVLFLVLAFCGKSHALDRCQDYVTDIRIQHYKYFGLNFPWHYGVGQLKQESNCRADITAFDGGIGIAQMMPQTSQYIQSLMKEKLNPYNPEHAIRMQAFYMCQLHKENWDGALWLTYQAYNGGWTLLNKEKERACHTDWSLMYAECKRKIITLKSGKLLDFCEVNYDYSKKTYKYGNQYRTFEDKWRYW